MKINVCFFVTAVAAMLCSCSQHDTFHEVGPAGQEYVTFAVESPAEYSTKAGGQTDEEKTVNDVQFVVYNPDGSMNGYGSSSSGTCQVKITRGSSLMVYAAVNMASLDLSQCYNESQIKSQVTCLADNAKNGFHMLGRKVMDMSTGSTFTVPVSRFASKVSLEKVTKDFAVSAMNDLPMTITGMYLINVAGSCNFMREPLSAVWYNQRQYTAGDDRSGLFSDKSPSVNLDAAGSVAVNGHFYCYPNNVAKAQDTTSKDGAFTPRLTRLVVEVSMNGHTYYYPVDICSSGAALASNKHYLIKNLKITGLGSDSPDVKPSVDVVDFSVEVLDWDEEVSEEIVY